MGKKSAPKAPPVPDPSQLVKAQTEANRFNTVTPFGSTTWVPKYSQPEPVYSAQPVGEPVLIDDATGSIRPLGYEGGGSSPEQNSSRTTVTPVQNPVLPPISPEIESWTQVTSLSPEIQALFDNQLSKMGAASDRGTPEIRSYAPARDIPVYGGDTYNALEDALYNRSMRLLEPRFEQQSNAFEQEMYNRGTPVGSEIYADKFNLIQDAQNNARESAAINAVMAGRGAFENDRNFTNIQNQQDFSNENMLTEMDRNFWLNQNNQSMNQQQIDFNQLATLLGGSAPAPVAPIDVMGAHAMQQNAANNAYMADMNSYNNFWGGLTGLGGTLGAAYMLSDLRLKSNVVKIGEVGGLDLITWDWTDKAKESGLPLGPTFGFSAQQVKAKYPEHVTEISGYLAVDYSSLSKELAA